MLKSNKVFLRGILYHNFITLSFSVYCYAKCHILLRRVGYIHLQDQLQKIYLTVNLDLSLEGNQVNLSKNLLYLCEDKASSIWLPIALFYFSLFAFL